MHETPPNDRRSFLQWALFGLGGLFSAVIGFPAVAYILDARNRKAGAGAFRTVARLSELQVDVPKEVVIREVRRDAWTLHPNDVLGRVWLVRRGPDQVDAYTTTCPHLGCSINYVAGQQQFICPCHNGTWNLQCQKVDTPDFTNPAPRDMDLLDSKLVPDPDPSHAIPDPTTQQPKQDKLIEVRYQNFFQGLHEKKVKT